MELKVLKSSIFANKIPKFIVFFDNEPALSRQYIEYMVNALNKPCSYYDTADGAMYDITTGLKDDKLYVITDDAKVVKKNNFKNYVDNLISFDKNIILYFSHYDVKSDFYKYVEKYSVIFERQDRNTLLAYTEKLCRDHKVKIDRDKLFEIIDRCECNLGEIENELDKIFILEQANSNVLAEYMLNNGFSDYRKVNVERFAESAVRGKEDCLEMFQRMPNSAVEYLLYMYNYSKRMLTMTKNPYFGKVMKLCFEMYSRIVADPGEIKDTCAIKYTLYKLISGGR